MTTVLEVLKKAREIISVPERWTTDAFARDALGNAVGPLSSRAVCWCAAGALDKATMGDTRLRIKASTLMWAANNKSSFVDANDEQGREAVLEYFDKAIEAAS